MPTIRISKRSVSVSEPGLSDQMLWDDELSGFGLKITPMGRRVYLVQYRLGGRKGRTRRVTIGVHGRITAEEARVEQFIMKALNHAIEGVAMLVRTSFLEGIGRHKRLFSVRPPSRVAQFAERVPILMSTPAPKGKSWGGSHTAENGTFSPV